MSQQVTLKNISNNPMLVGDKFLFPNETRTVPKKIADQAIAKNESALQVRAATDELDVEETGSEQSGADGQADAGSEQDEEAVNDGQSGAAGGAAPGRVAR